MTDGWMPPKGAVWPNKHAVRITVLIPRSDPKLHHWPAWGRKRLAPEWYATLDRSGGGKSKTVVDLLRHDPAKQLSRDRPSDLNDGD
jgi:hypothetical protein